VGYGRCSANGSAQGKRTKTKKKSNGMKGMEENEMKTIELERQLIEE